MALNIILEGYTSYLVIWNHIESLPKSFQKWHYRKIAVSHEMIFRIFIFSAAKPHSRHRARICGGSNWTVVSSFVVSWCCRFTDGLHHQSTKKSKKIHQKSIQNLWKSIPNGTQINPKSVKMWFCVIRGVLRCRICEKMKTRIKRTPKLTDFGSNFLNKK